MNEYELAREEYEKKIMQKSQQAKAPAEAPPVEGKAMKEAGMAMGSQAAVAGAQQGDLLSTVGGGMMMSGNPYAMAAGLGVQVLAAGEKNKRAAQEQQRQEYNARIARRQELMNKIAQTGIE